MKKKFSGEVCGKCDRVATWVRMTQFSGNFFFCTEDAKKEKDFRKETNEDTFFWEKL